eukprot:1347459-Pyramimonas_sp.AAC.1
MRMMMMITLIVGARRPGVQPSGVGGQILSPRKELSGVDRPPTLTGRFRNWPFSFTRGRRGRHFC